MKHTYALGHRLIAHVLLWGLLLQSCYSPPVPLSLRNTEKQGISREVIPHTRADVIHQEEEEIPPSQSIGILTTAHSHAEGSQEVSMRPSLPDILPATDYYEAKGGYRVKFIQQKRQAWIAKVQDNFTGFHGSFKVPVYPVDYIGMGKRIQDLCKHTPEWVKSHIHVYQPAKGKEGYVWVGETGLQGGGGNMSSGICEVAKEPIHIAAKEGDLAQIRALTGGFFFIRKESIDIPDANLNTPLHYAAHNKQKEAVELLLSRGAKPDLRDNKGKTALHYAVTVPVANALIQEGANKDLQDDLGRTPLHQAIVIPEWLLLISDDNLDLVRLLLQAYANTEISDNKGNKPLHDAVWNKALTQLLLSNGANKEAKDAEAKTPLFSAVKCEHLETIRLLVEEGANKEAKDPEGNNLLHEAIANFFKRAESIKGHFDQKEESLKEALQKTVGVIKLLIELKVNPYFKNNQGKTPIHLVLASNDEGLAKQLLNALGVETYQDQAGYTVLHRMILDRDIALFKQLIALDINKNPKDSQWNTPLHLAVERGDMAMVEQLVKLGAGLHASNKDGFYPIHLAIVRGNSAIARRLMINEYTHINVIDNKQHNTPLHLAIAYNRQNLINDFVQAGANLHYANRSGFTPIELASVNKHLEYVQQIFAALPSTSNQVNTLGGDGLGHIHRAIKRKDLQLARRLLSIRGVDINQYGRTPLHMAVEQEDMLMIKLLLSAGAKKDIKNHDGKTVIQLTLQNTNPKLIKQLLSVLGVDIHVQDQNGHTLLHHAICDDDTASFKQLVALGVNINIKDKHGDTPLHCVVRKHPSEIVKQLIELGSNINAKNIYEETPLHIAACCGYEAITELLIGAGADRNTKDAKGNTPLHHAIKAGKLAIIKRLVEKGVDLHISNEQGLTPIELASVSNHLDYVAQIFLIKHADINTVGTDQLTHTQRAIDRGDLHLFKQLIDCGASRDIKDQASNTLLHRAMQHGELAIAKHLVAIGADLHANNKEGLTPIELASVNNHLACIGQILSMKDLPSILGTDVFGYLQRVIERGDLGLLKELLACGVDLKIKDQADNFLLHLAVKNDQKDIVALLIKLKANPDVEDQFGNTPLHLAVVLGRKTIVDLLLKANADKELKNKSGATPLHLAVSVGQEAIAKLLIEAGANKNIQDQAGNTFLHIAIQKGKLAIVTYLIETGADLHLPNQAGLTPIDLASTSNHLEYLASIFDIQGVNIDAAGLNSMTHLHHAVKRGDEKLVQQLIACKANVKANGRKAQTPIHLAAAKGYTIILQHLAKKLSELKSKRYRFFLKHTPLDIPDQQGNTPLHLAADKGHLTTVQFLLQEKADLYIKNKKGLTPIHKALAAKQDTLLKTLLFVPGCSPLHVAADHRDIDLIKQLLAIGIDIDTMDSTGKTILCIAFEKKDSSLTKQLIELGAQINARDNKGRTILHHAIVRGDILVANALLVAKADLHIADHEGLTALHLAAQYNLAAIARQLVHLGARINAKDAQGRTPLHVAAQHGHHAMSQLLIQAGADLQAVDAQIFTPLAHALQQGHLTVVKLLAAANEYSLHIQRCIAAANNTVALPKESQTKTTKSKLPEKGSPLLSLNRFISEYADKLVPEDQQKFLEEIAPLLMRKLDKVSWQLQDKIIQYFQEEGIFYGFILNKFEAPDWISQSLLLDISQEILINQDELIFGKLQESVTPMVQSYPVKQLESVLFSLREKQYIQQLTPQNLCEISTYLSALTPQQALDHLKLADDAWFASLRLAWLAKETQRLYSSFTLEQCSQLSYALAQTNWEVELVATFVTKLKAEKDFRQVEKLMSFLAKTQPDPDIVLMAIYQKPKQAEQSIAQAWQHYIACELLKNKLFKLFPTYHHRLEKQAYNLLYQDVSYEEIDALLDHLGATNYQDTVSKAQRLFDVWDLLVEYGTTAAVCQEAFQVIQQKPSTAWEEEIHAQVIAATFGKAHERSIEEIIDYVAAKSSQTPFANNKEALHKSYHSVLAAYQGTSHILPTNKTIIAQWQASDITHWAQQVKGTTALRAMSPATQHEVLAVIRQAVKLYYGYYPRATQLLALLLYLNHTSGKGRLGQINTGEGKTLIVAMLAAILALQGKKVDVVTTSTELSIPAVADQKGFFSMLGLTVGENSDEEKKKEIYTSDIVYGTVTRFQAHILTEEFLGEEVRGARGFEKVIVDEVDSMLFDSRNASVRLARYAPAMHHLEILLGAVYNQVSRTLRHMLEKDGQTYYIHENFEVKDGKITFYNTPAEVMQTDMLAVYDKEGFIKQITREHVENLIRNPPGAEYGEWQAYKKHQKKIVKASIRLFCEEDEKKREQKAEACKKLAEEIKELAWVKNKRVHVVEIPQHLESFAKKQIDNWTKSAIQAICTYKKELHYDLQNGKIIPIDWENTGVLQSNTVWSNGLAQMLQIKEGLPVEPEGISTNFISIPEFFRRYNNAIYGLTGTLGNEATQQFLADIYGVDQLILPTYQLLPIAGNESSKYVCKELPPIVVSNSQKWQEAIFRTTLHKVNNQRAVLIICKYIDQVKKVAQLLSEQYDQQKILTYTGQEDFDKKSIESGEIIVATNIAGRGTDIKTSAQVEANGGLHVCITFLPDSDRVELQNAGRTAREGKKGTAQLVIQANANIQDLKSERDEKEFNAINRAKQDVKAMLFKDRLFSRFCALEAEILPTIAWNTKVNQLNQLHKFFEKERSKIQQPGGLLDQLYEKDVSIAAEKEFHQKNPQFGINISGQALPNLASLKQELYKKLDKATTLSKLEKQLRANICLQVKGYFTEDVIERFSAGYNCLSSNAELATKYGWGRYERLGVEERWGIWLQHALEGKHIENEEAIWQDFQEFADYIRDNANRDQLIRNPYYYIIKGNGHLNNGKHDQAIASYDRAIALDQLHSVNAYYNKAKLLISLSKDDQSNFKKAIDALKQAKVILANHSKQNILTFNSLVASIGGAKPHLLEHLQHQLNILMQQESYIDAALKELNIAQEKKWNLEITELKSLKEVVEEAKGDHGPAIRKAEQNGLHALFVVKAKQPYPWKSILALALLGVVQVATGVLLNCIGATTVGMGMINEGISDLIACGTAAIKGTFDWTQWAIQKAISITSSIVSGGIDNIKKAWGELKNMKEGVKTLTISGLKEGAKKAGQKLAVDLCKGTVKMLATEFVNTALEEKCVKEVVKWFEKEITNSLERKIANSALITKALELDVKHNNNYWQQIFLKEGLDMLTKTDGKWAQFLQGVAGNVIKQGIADVVGGGRNAIVVQSWLQSGKMLKALTEVLTMTDQFWEEFLAHIKSKYSQEIDEAVAAQAKKETQTDKDQASTKKTEQQSKSSGVEQFTTAPELADGEISVIKVTSSTSINSVVQDRGSELMEHFQGADSHSNQLVTSFGRVLKSKVSHTIQAEMIHPITSGVVNLGIDKIAEGLQNNVDNAIAAYNNERQGEIASDKQANSKAETKVPNFEELPSKTQEHIKRLQEDGKGNVEDFPGLSQLTGKSILVKDKDGNLMKIVGSNHEGDPITITYDRSNGGHYEASDPKVKVPEGGRQNDCLIKAVYTQLTPEDRQKLGANSLESFSQKYIDHLGKNSGGMQHVYKHTEVMKRFDPSSTMEGGRISKPKVWNDFDSKGRFHYRRTTDGKWRKVYHGRPIKLSLLNAGNSKKPSKASNKSEKTNNSHERHPDTPAYGNPRIYKHYANILLNREQSLPGVQSTPKVNILLESLRHTQGISAKEILEEQEARHLAKEAEEARKAAEEDEQKAEAAKAAKEKKEEFEQWSQAAASAKKVAADKGKEKEETDEPGLGNEQNNDNSRDLEDDTQTKEDKKEENASNASSETETLTDTSSEQADQEANNQSSEAPSEETPQTKQSDSQVNDEQADTSMYTTNEADITNEQKHEKHASERTKEEGIAHSSRSSQIDQAISAAQKNVEDYQKGQNKNSDFAQDNADIQTLDKKMKDYQAACAKNPEFIKQKEHLADLDARIQADPNNQALLQEKDRCINQLKKQPLYQQGIELTNEANRLFDQAQKQAHRYQNDFQRDGSEDKLKQFQHYLEKASVIEQVLLGVEKAQQNQEYRDKTKASSRKPDEGSKQKQDSSQDNTTKNRMSSANNQSTSKKGKPLPSRTTGNKLDFNNGQKIPHSIRVIKENNDEKVEKTIAIHFGSSDDGISADNKVNPKLAAALEKFLNIVSQDCDIKSIYISTTTNGEHDPESNHYADKARALDISRINDKLIVGMQPNDPIILAFQSALEKLPNIRENFGPALFLKWGENYLHDKLDPEDYAERKKTRDQHFDHIHFSVDP